MKLHENEFSEIITKTIEESSLSPYYKTRAKSYFRKHKVSGNIINIVAKHWYVEYIKKATKEKTFANCIIWTSTILDCQYYRDIHGNLPLK